MTWLDKYFRIGHVSNPTLFVLLRYLRMWNLLYRHMGITVVEPQRGDITKIITSLQDALEEARAAKKV